jgi:hypothetical protein
MEHGTRYNQVGEEKKQDNAATTGTKVDEFQKENIGGASLLTLE